MEQKLQLVAPEHKLSIRRQCNILEVNRSNYYYESQAADDTEIANLIREIWLSHTFYGYRKISKILRRDYGHTVNDKKVLRLMRELGIQAVYAKPNLSKPGVYIKPYLLKDLNIATVNKAWMVDITYIKLNGRFTYLVALIDVFSRFVVGFNLSYSLDTENSIDALEQGLKLAGVTPDIVNSDQGTQFTSTQWLESLCRLNIAISMDGKGRWADNIYIERFWRNIKYEDIHLSDYSNFTELYHGIKNYIEFYNYKRPHQSLNYLTPSDLYLQQEEKIA